MTRKEPPRHGIALVLARRPFLLGDSDSSHGVLGTSRSGSGVWGINLSNWGMFGQSGTNVGVWGACASVWADREHVGAA